MAAVSVVLAGAALSAAAPRPATIAGVAPGLWEVGGSPGLNTPTRACVGSAIDLAQLEHRGRRCNRTVLRDDGTVALVEYSCSSGDFGRSKLTQLTPRSLRIETQGISDRLPFNYVVQARRVGDCQAKTTASAAH